MISVEFHDAVSGNDRAAQVLTWDGQNYTLSPPDPEQLYDILRKRIKDPDSGRVVTSQEPEVFMACLQHTYKSAYFWADPPVTVGAVQPA